MEISESEIGKVSRSESELARPDIACTFALGRCANAWSQGLVLDEHAGELRRRDDVMTWWSSRIFEPLAHPRLLISKTSSEVGYFQGSGRLHLARALLRALCLLNNLAP
jgi:hypothetical protein